MEALQYTVEISSRIVYLESDLKLRKAIIIECSGPYSCKKNRDLKFLQSEDILEIQDIGIHLDDLDHFEIDWIFEEDNARVDCMFDDKNENQGKV